MNPQSQEVLKSDLREHAIEFSNWFNEASAKEGLGVILDPEQEIIRISLLRDLKLMWRQACFSEHKATEAQVQTAVKAIARTIGNPGGLGLVLGESQSEKTSLALLMLFAIPVHYFRSNLIYVPLYVTTNRNSEQLRILGAMRAFINLYGDINIVSANGFECDTDNDPHAETYIAGCRKDDQLTLGEFAGYLAQDQSLGADRVGSFVKTATMKLRPGKMALDVNAYCDRARRQGHEVMLVVEEAKPPMIGVDGKPERKTPCPLSRSLTDLGEDVFSPSNHNFMVGFAEKPLAKVPVGKIWTVSQKLASGENPTFGKSA